MALSDWTTDLAHAARALKRTPEFTLTSAGILGLAIGALAGMFSVVDAVLLQPLPFASPDRLVHIAASAPGSEFPPEFGASSEFFVQYQERSHQLEDISTYNSFTTTIREGERVERLRISWPTNSMYSTLGVSPVLGRLPVAADESRTVIISDALWSAWFGRDPAVIGRSLDVSNGLRTVIGVMGPEFQFPNADTQAWVSSTLTAADIEETGDFDVDLVGRMAQGATLESVANELTALAREAPQRFGGNPAYARTVAQHRAIVRPLETRMLGSVSGSLWVLLGAACMVLLIACANVANLFLVRAGSRHQALAVRRALGAARSQLLRLQMAEALLIAAIAAAMGLLLAVFVLPAFLSMAPPGIPRLNQVSLNANTLIFIGIAALAAALLCGLAPALRGSSPDLTRMREGGRGSTRRHWVRYGLVVGQTALALVLLIGSGLLLRSAYALRHVDPGYETEDVFTFQMAPQRPQLQDAHDFARFNLEFLTRLSALQGVQSAGLVENVPLNEATTPMRVRTEIMNSAAGEGSLVNVTNTAGDYFKTMGIPVLAGRVFGDADHSTQLGNAIVSETAARMLWPGQDPIGKRLQRLGEDTWQTVVGQVGDIKQSAFRDAPEALLYLPMVDTSPRGGRPSASPAFVIKTNRADSITPDVRALVREVAPEAPMYRDFTLARLAQDSMMEINFTLLTLAVTALLALLLGAVGLYGVLSFIVAERTREIGVRMALGARQGTVRAMVVKQGLHVVGAGVIIGLGVALVLTRALGSLLFGVQAIDMPTFAAMAAVMLSIGLTASYLPARRASNLDPMESLKRD